MERLLGMAESSLNFDAKRGDEKAVRDFVRDFFKRARDSQRYKHEEFQRIYNMYKLMQDMTGRDPNRANIFIPILYWITESIMPIYVDALLGLRPYIPIELNQDRNSAIGDTQTLLVDLYLEDSQFFYEAVKMIKWVLLMGTAFIEVYPDYETTTVKSFEPRFMTDMNGNRIPVDFVPKTEKKKLFKLGIKAYPPWQIYRDPAAHSVAGSRGIIKFRGMASKRQLKEMAARGAFPDFDLNKLDYDMAELRDEDWSKNMARDIGVSMPQYDDDLGVWLSFESNGRMIDMWNFGTVLRDIDNPYEHGGINLTRLINTDDPNNYSDWFGIGEGRPIENLAYGLNDNWNQTFNNHNMLNEAVIYYDEDAISVDQLVMVAGNRIPVRPDPGKPISEAVHEREMRGLPPDHYVIPGAFERFIEQTAGVHRGTRGEADPKSKTAREALMLKQADDLRMKLKIKMGEKMGLADFAKKLVSIIDQFASKDDIINKIGVKAASQLPTVNPAFIDGGYSFSMKGSGRMADAMVKRQDAKDIFQLMEGYPTIRQDWLANWVLQRFEVSDEERRKAVLPDEHALQLKMMLSQMEASGKGSSTRLLSDGRTAGSMMGQQGIGRDASEKLSPTI